jgi:WD40 repeat protein
MKRTTKDVSSIVVENSKSIFHVVIVHNIEMQQDPAALVYADSPIRSICLSPSGSKLLTGQKGYEKADIILYNLTNPTGKQILHGHTKDVISIFVSDCEKWAVSFGKDNHIHLWDLHLNEASLHPRESRKTNEINDEDMENTQVFILKQSIFMVGGTEIYQWFFDPQTGKWLDRRVHATSSPMISVTISPNEQYYCTVSKSNVIRIWDFKKNEAIRTYRQLENVYSAWIFENKLYICQNVAKATSFACFDWEITTTSRIKDAMHQIFHIDSEKHIKRVKVSSDGSYCLVGYKDGFIHLWNTGESSLDFPSCSSKVNSAPIALALSKDNQKTRFSVLRRGSVVTTWDLLPQLTKLLTLKHKFTASKLLKDNSLELKQGSIVAATLASNINMSMTPFIAFAIEDDSRGFILDLSTRKVFELHADDEDEQEGQIVCMEISNNREIIVAGCSDGMGYVWQVENRKFLCKLDGHEAGHQTIISSIAISNDARTIVTGGIDMKVILWKLEVNLQTVTIYQSFSCPKRVYQVLLKENSDSNTMEESMVLAASTAEIYVWKVSQSLKPEYKLLLPDFLPIRGLFLHPDYPFLFASDDSSVKIYDISIGIKIIEYDIDKCYRLFLSPQGRFLLTFHSQVIKFWDPLHGQLIYSISNHISTDDERNKTVFDAVNFRCFGNSENIFVASRNKFILLYPFYPTLNRLYQPKIFGNYVIDNPKATALNFSQKGDKLLCAYGEERKICVWNLSSTYSCFLNTSDYVILLNENIPIDHLLKDAPLQEPWVVCDAEDAESCSFNKVHWIEMKGEKGKIVSLGGIWDPKSDGNPLFEFSHLKLPTDSNKKLVDGHIDFGWPAANTSKFISIVDASTSVGTQVSFNLKSVSKILTKQAIIWEFEKDTSSSFFQRYQNQIKVFKVFQLDKEISDCYLSPNGNRSFLVDMKNYVIKVYCEEDVNEPSIILKDINCSECITFTANGDLLAVSSNETGLQLWDVDAMNMKMELGSKYKKSKICKTCTFTRNDSLLIAGYNDGQVMIWEVDTGECLRILNYCIHGRAIHSLTCHDGKFYTAGQDDSYALQVIENPFVFHRTYLPLLSSPSAFLYEYLPDVLRGSDKRKIYDWEELKNADGYLLRSVLLFDAEMTSNIFDLLLSWDQENPQRKSYNAMKYLLEKVPQSLFFMQGETLLQRIINVPQYMPEHIRVVLDIQAHLLQDSLQDEMNRNNSNEQEVTPFDIRSLLPYQGESIPDGKKLSKEKLHISDMVDIDDICLVAEKYPEIFLSFVKQLQLCRNYRICQHVDCQRLPVERDRIYLGSTERCEHNLWTKTKVKKLVFLDGEFENKFAPYLIPISEIASADSPFLGTVIKSIERLNRIKVFNNEVLQVLVGFKWRISVRFIFYRDFVLQGILTVSYLIKTAVFNQYIVDSSHSPSYLNIWFLLMILTTLLVLFFMSHECAQLFDDLQDEKQKKTVRKARQYKDEEKHQLHVHHNQPHQRSSFDYGMVLLKEEKQQELAQDNNNNNNNKLEKFLPLQQKKVMSTKGKSLLSRGSISTISSKIFPRQTKKHQVVVPITNDYEDENNEIISPRSNTIVVPQFHTTVTEEKAKDTPEKEISKNAAKAKEEIAENKEDFMTNSFTHQRQLLASTENNDNDNDISNIKNHQQFRIGKFFEYFRNRWRDIILIQGFLAFFSNTWNVLQVVTYSLVMLTNFFEILAFVAYSSPSSSVTQSEIKNSLNKVLLIAAVVMPLLACEMLFYLSGIPSTGPLVRMIVRIIQGSFTFGTVLAIMIFSFAGSYLLLFTNVHPPDGFSDDEVSTIETIVRNYNHYHTALTTVYGFLFGSYTLDDFKYSQSKSLAILLLYLFLFFVVIIMLNLLIAIMADKYAEVQGHARAEAMYAKAMIVLEYEKKFLKSLMKQNSNQQSKKSCSWYFAWICSFQCGPFMPNPLNNQQLQLCFPRWVHVLKKEVEGGSSISSDQNSLGISLDGDAGIGEDDDRVGWVGQMTAIKSMFRKQGRLIDARFHYLRKKLDTNEDELKSKIEHVENQLVVNQRLQLKATTKSSASTKLPRNNYPKNSHNNVNFNDSNDLDNDNDDDLSLEIRPWLTSSLYSKPILQKDQSSESTTSAVELLSASSLTPIIRSTNVSSRNKNVAIAIDRQQETIIEIEEEHHHHHHHHTQYPKEIVQSDYQDDKLLYAPSIRRKSDLSEEEKEYSSQQQQQIDVNRRFEVIDERLTSLETSMQTIHQQLDTLIRIFNNNNNNNNNSGNDANK